MGELDVNNGAIKTQRFNNGSSTWDSEITVASDMIYCNGATMRRQWDAAKLNNNEIHVVVIDRDGRLDHYKRAGSNPYSWSTVQSDITGLTSHTRVTLSTDGTNLWAIYDKGDNKIYYRKWNGSSWGSETVIKDTTTTLQGAIDSSEKMVDGRIGVVWVEGSGSPYDVQFSTIPIVTKRWGEGTCGGTCDYTGVTGDAYLDQEKNNWNLGGEGEIRVGGEIRLKS